MKTAILILLIITTCALAQPTNDVFVRERTMCLFDKFVCQWDIIDSNMGVVTYYFTEVPPYTIVDANIGKVVFTPQETGTFNIRMFATCELNDPNACLWPEIRNEEVQITVNPSQVWKLRFVELQE